MKKAYERPTLVEFGDMTVLTRGTSGSLQEVDQNGQVQGQCTGESENQVDCHVVYV